MDKYENAKNEGSLRPILRSMLASTMFLTNGLWLVGITILFGGFALVNRMYPSNIPDIYLGIIIIIGFPWLITGCIFVILRKEIPRFGLPSIKGTWAITQGLVGLVILTFTELYVIYLVIRELYNP